MCNLPSEERNNQGRQGRFLRLPNPNSIAGQLTIGDAFSVRRAFVLVLPEMTPDLPANDGPFLRLELHSGLEVSWCDFLPSTSS